MAGGAWVTIVEIGVFLVSTWMMGRGFRAVGLSPIIGEILAGVVLGPHVLNVVPYAEPGNSGSLPTIFVLMGQVGVTLMIMESGMHISFEKVRMVGKKAASIAVLGTLLPLCAGMGLVWAMGYPAYPDGLAAGTALAPTSVGIALKLLNESKSLNSSFGQCIITAAFGDDVLSLIILVLVLNVTGGAFSAWTVLLPVVLSISFVAVGVLLSMRAFPRMVDLLSRVGEVPSASHQPRDELHLAIMITTLVAYGFIGDAIGSHLLGAFVAGMSFTYVPRSMLVWRRQVKRILYWLVRLFFAATVAFAIPVEVMLSWSSLWQGAVLGALACVGAKLLSGVAAGGDTYVIGWAMVGRGEFAYLVAQVATQTKLGGSDTVLMSPRVFSAVVWALLFSTVIAPIAFKAVLKRRLAMLAARPGRRSSLYGDKLPPADGRFRIRVEGHHHTGILHEVCDSIHTLGLDVVEASVDSDGNVDIETFTVRPRGGGTLDLDEEKLHEMKHELMEAVSDPDAQICFLPMQEVEGQVMEIHLMARHHPQLLHEIMDLLATLHLEVDKAAVHEAEGQTDIDVFYGENGQKLTDGHVEEVRSQLTGLMHSHRLHGEVMVRLTTREAEKHATWDYAPNLTGEDGAFKISVLGYHRPGALQELTDTLAAMDLDVLHATMEHRGNKDLAVFYAQEPEEEDRKGAPRRTTGKRRASIHSALVKMLHKQDSHARVTVQRVHLDVATGQIADNSSTGSSPSASDAGSSKPRSPARADIVAAAVAAAQRSRRWSSSANGPGLDPAHPISPSSGTPLDCFGVRMPHMSLTPLMSPAPAPRLPRSTGAEEGEDAGFSLGPPLVSAEDGPYTGQHTGAGLRSRASSHSSDVGSAGRGAGAEGAARRPSNGLRRGRSGSTGSGDGPNLGVSATQPRGRSRQARRPRSNSESVISAALVSPPPSYAAAAEKDTRKEEEKEAARSRARDAVIASLQEGSSGTAGAGQVGGAGSRPSQLSLVGLDTAAEREGGNAGQGRGGAEGQTAGSEAQTPGSALPLLDREGAGASGAGGAGQSRTQGATRAQGQGQGRGASSLLSWATGTARGRRGGHAAASEEAAPSPVDATPRTAWGWNEAAAEAETLRRAGESGGAAEGDVVLEVDNRKQ